MRQKTWIDYRWEEGTKVITNHPDGLRACGTDFDEYKYYVVNCVSVRLAEFAWNLS